MICLFLDSSSEKLKVSLLKDNNLIFDKELITKNDHSSYLIPCIEEAFKNNNIDYKDLNRIIVGVGPGSFTGTRISITVAKVYADAFNIELYGISSLEMMIYGNEEYDYYVPVIEDKNNKLYYSIFDKNKRRIIDDKYSTLDELYNVLDSYEGNILIISHYNKKYDKFSCTTEILDAQEINKNILINNEKINPHLLKPNYIKKIEAETKI